MSFDNTPILSRNSIMLNVKKVRFVTFFRQKSWWIGTAYHPLAYYAGDRNRNVHIYDAKLGMVERTRSRALARENWRFCTSADLKCPILNHAGFRKSSPSHFEIRYMGVGMKHCYMYESILAINISVSFYLSIDGSFSLSDIPYRRLCLHKQASDIACHRAHSELTESLRPLRTSCSTKKVMHLIPHTFSSIYLCITSRWKRKLTPPPSSFAT